MWAIFDMNGNYMEMCGLFKTKKHAERYIYFLPKTEMGHAMYFIRFMPVKLG